MLRETILFPFQRVVTTEGDVVIVAFIRHGQVFAYGRNGFRVVEVVTDAFGGEHDQSIGLIV